MKKVYTAKKKKISRKEKNSHTKKKILSIGESQKQQ